jgi:hypothetical protein
MKKIKKLLFLSFLCSFSINSAISQVKTSHYIATNLVSFMNIHHSYIPIEYNHQLNNRLRLNTSLGFILNTDFWRGNSGNKDSIKTIGKHDASGFRFSIEPQFFFKRFKPKNNFYIGIDLNAIHYKYISERAIAFASYQTRRYNVDSKSLGTNLLFGATYVTTERIVMSTSGGFGVKYLKVKNDLDVPVSSLHYLNRLGEAVEIEENGKYRRFTFVINTKIGFWLGKKNK